jgi:hypothetical protein
MNPFSETLLNIHEDMRKLCSWTVIAWLQVIDEEKSTRPIQGFDSDAARNVRLFHACWNLLLKTWTEDTEITWVVSYGDNLNRARFTHHNVGTLLGNMQAFMIFVIFVFLSILNIFVILCIFRNSISGHVNLLRHVIAALQASMTFSEQFCQALCCVKECKVNALVNHIFFIFLILNLFCVIFIILHIWHIVHIKLHFNIFMARIDDGCDVESLLTTGMLRTIAPDQVFLFGLTAGTNKPRHHIPNRAVETLPAFEPTFGIAQGFGVF